MFAADSTSGNVKFRDKTTTLTVRTVTADVPCFPAAVTGVTGPADAAICNTGNLVLNAADAMSGVDDRPRQLGLRTERSEEGGVSLFVEDAGVGFSAQDAERLPFGATQGNHA